MKKRNFIILLSISIFLLFLPILLNKYNFVSNTGKPTLEQSIEDKEMWEEYISLGLYRTTITNNMTIEEIQNEILKSHVFVTIYVRIETIYGTLENPSIGRGSGFVIDIDENYIYIATNQHVVNMGNKNAKKYYIRFSNNINNANTIMENYDLKGELIDFKYNPDYAIIKVDISNVPYNERYVFKAIPKIEEIQLEQGMTVYMYHMTKDCNETLKQGTLSSTEKIEGFDTTMCYYTSPISVKGNSGSLIFTQNGQCLGMLVGKINNQSVIIPYDLLVSNFETIVGRPLYPEENIEQENNEENSIIEEMHQEPITHSYYRNRYEEINIIKELPTPIWYIKE